MSYYADILKIAESDDLPWDDLSGKNILITGATGLIGSCLVDILMSRKELNYRVYAAGRNERRAKLLFSRFWDSPFFVFLSFDVCDIPDFKIDFHYIISAASGANPILYSKDPVGVMKTNFYGTDNLLNYGVNHSLKKFVFVSSGDVYGEGNGMLMKENYCGYMDPLVLRSSYGTVKRACESLCISYASQFGINVSIARPCHTYGPHFTESDSRAFAQFFRNAVHGEDIVMKSAGIQMRSWCYVVDCACGILFVLLKGKNCNAYNVADEKSILSIKAFAEMIAVAGGVNLVIDAPSDIEKKGFSVITNSMFDVTNLKNLGWRIAGSVQDKIESTLQEIKHN